MPSLLSQHYCFKKRTSEIENVCGENVIILCLKLQQEKQCTSYLKNRESLCIVPLRENDTRVRCFLLTYLWLKSQQEIAIHSK